MEYGTDSKGDMRGMQGTALVVHANVCASLSKRSSVCMPLCPCLGEGKGVGSSPAHSGLSSSKFTAKSCETFRQGRKDKAFLLPQHTTHTQHDAFSPIYRLTGVFPFHVDQKQAEPPKRSQI